MSLTKDQAFANYVISSGALTELKKLSQEMETQMQESKIVLQDIADSYKSLKDCSKYACTDEITRHEEISKFLEADKPRMLLPDMDKFYDSDVDVEQTILRTKSTLEQLKNRVTPVKPKINIDLDCNFITDLQTYKASLELFSKRLLNIQKIKTDGKSMRDLELEQKLQLLCTEMQNFSKMILTKSKLGQHNGSEVDVIETNTSLEYDDTIRNILDHINELTFLLRNNNS